METTTQAAISLERIQRQIAVIEIKGTAPLIVHRWSEKARREMLDKQQGRKVPKAPKNPQQDFEDARYRLADGRDGAPTMAFKSATVKGGARAFGKSVKMTELRQALVFLPDGVGTDGTQLTIINGEPTIREDMVQIAMATADIRYRPEFRDWGAILRVEFMPNLVDVGTIAALIDAGGSNGVGEWRPEKNGNFGTYEVVGEGVE